MRSIASELPPVAARSRIDSRISGNMRWDLAGLGLAAAAVGWVYVAAADDGGSPARVVALIAASAGAYTAARMVGSFARWLLPLGVVATGMWIFLRDPGAVLNDHPLGGPFAYANARAAFFALAAASGLMLAAAVRRAPLWAAIPAAVAGIGAAAVFAIVPFATGTHAGMIAVGALPVAGLLARSPRASRLVVMGSAAALLSTLAVTTYLATTYEAGSTGIVSRLVDATPLNEHRVELWHEAIVIMADHPVTGVGPGRFHEVSPEARADFDSRNARHEFLQFGAETGVPGMLLLASLFLWGLARLRAAGAADQVVALAAVALAVLGMHACIDYVLHFPALSLVAAGLVGTAVAPPRSQA